MQADDSTYYGKLTLSLVDSAPEWTFPLRFSFATTHPRVLRPLFNFPSLTTGPPRANEDGPHEEIFWSLQDTQLRYSRTAATFVGPVRDVATLSSAVRLTGPIFPNFEMTGSQDPGEGVRL